MHFIFKRVGSYENEVYYSRMVESEIHTLNDELRDMAADTLVIGDMAFDVEMAHNAGAKACAVTYGNGTRAQLSDAEWLIDDFGEILEKLK